MYAINILYNESNITFNIILLPHRRLYPVLYLYPLIKEYSKNV